MKELPSPVAYSLPMLGRTFSPADNETKRAKGISQMHNPKKDATSVKVGISCGSVYIPAYEYVDDDRSESGEEKCLNQR